MDHHGNTNILEAAIFNHPNLAIPTFLSWSAQDCHMTNFRVSGF